MVSQAQRTGFFTHRLLSVNLHLKVFTKLHDSSCKNSKLSSFWGCHIPLKHSPVRPSVQLANHPPNVEDRSTPLHVCLFFGGCQNETHVYRFLKSTHLGSTFPVYLTYIKFLPSPPPPSCRGTQIILISSIYGMHSYQNFAPKLWKKCCKGVLFWKGNLSWRAT